MPNNNQYIFRYPYLQKMLEDLRNGKSLSSYAQDKYKFDDTAVLQTSIECEGKKPDLKVSKKDQTTADLENAIAVHKYYPKLDSTQASDPRLWAYLSHVEFREYTMARWGIKGLGKDDAINNIFDHWFVRGYDRSLRRHSVARLWWLAHLTYAPWSDDYFSDLTKSDPYYYTKILLLKEDIYASLLERSMCRSKKILISILDYLDKNSEFAKSREKIRSLAKELNLTYGIKKLASLDRMELKELIEDIAKKI